MMQELQIAEGAVVFLDQMAKVNANSSPIRSPFHSTHTPPMTIRLYCERILKYSKCTYEAFVVGVLLLCKFAYFTKHPVCIFNVHRMLITSTLVAAKMRDDEYYSNTYYARIGGIAVQELNALEVHFLQTLNWDMWVGEEEYERAIAMMITLAEVASSVSPAVQAAATEGCQRSAAAVASAEELGNQVWSSWLHAFGEQTKKRSERVLETLRIDILGESSKTSQTSPTVDDESVKSLEFYAAAARRNCPPQNSVPKGVPQQVRMVTATQPRPYGVPQAFSQASVGHCESTASLDGCSSTKNEVSDSSGDGSGSLAPEGRSPSNPIVLNQQPVAGLPANINGESVTANIFQPGRSWATIARTTNGKPAPLSNLGQQEGVSGVDMSATPTTPTSHNNSGFSSQQATPTRLLTKQRFSSSRNTPTSGNVRRAYVDASAGVAVLRQAPPPTTVATTTTPTTVTTPSTGQQSSEGTEWRQGGGNREGKKRPKPEHYQDYR